MTTERLICNSCGAPLDVPSAANFVTCNHCSTQLKIRRDENVTFTEAIDRLTDKTDQLTEKVEHLTNLNQLSVLDSEWSLERENYMVTGKHGHRSIPSKGGALFGGIFVTIFGIFWTGMATSMGAPGFFPLFGVVFIGVGIVSSINAFNKAERYRSAERRYQQRRRELERQG